MKILVVDDEVRIRDLLGAYLTKEGYNIFYASNGKEALDIFKDNIINFVILDVMMPIMDGRQTCEAVRKMPELKDTMVVFLSAVQEEQCQIDSYEAGADDYITKPFLMFMLLLLRTTSLSISESMRMC